MKITTFNVNSVRPRLQHLLEYLRTHKPDVVLLQEIKCVNDAFPVMEIEELGYNIALHGEKTYNGVAILSLHPLEDITRGLPGDEADVQARYIEAVISVPSAQMSDDRHQMTGASLDICHLSSAIRVASVYVPNGQTPDSDKFPYKLRFMDRLRAHLATLSRYEEIAVIGGDYNVAPYDIDVANPPAWKNTVLCHDEVRTRLRATLNDGWYDAFRLAHPTERDCYSWWDYRGNGFALNDGLRIDHLLLSPQAADRLSGCVIHKDVRAADKASDHAPVMAVLGV